LCDVLNLKIIYCPYLIFNLYYKSEGGCFTSTGVIKPEGFWEKLGVFLDRLLNRYEKTNCDFCKKEITMERTLYNRYKGKASCSEACAKIMLRHF